MDPKSDLREHFEGIGTVRFPYPPPETAWSPARHSGWQIPDLEQARSSR